MLFRWAGKDKDYLDSSGASAEGRGAAHWVAAVHNFHSEHLMICGMFSPVKSRTPKKMIQQRVPFSFRPFAISISMFNYDWYVLVQGTAGLCYGCITALCIV